MTELKPCKICNQQSNELTHLSLYVFGSEGIGVCLNCRMAITEFVRQLCSVVSVAKKESYKAWNTRKEGDK